MRVRVIVNINLHRHVQHLGASRSARTMLPRACAESSSCPTSFKEAVGQLLGSTRSAALFAALSPTSLRARAGLACETFEFFNLAMCMWGAGAQHEGFSPRFGETRAISQQRVRETSEKDHSNAIFWIHPLSFVASPTSAAWSLSVTATDATAAMPTFFSSIFKLSIVSSLIVPSATSSPSSLTL